MKNMKNIKDIKEAAVNDPIPQELARALDVQPQGKSKADAFTRSFLRRSLQSGSKSDVGDILTHKALVLEHNKSKNKKPKNKKSKNKKSKNKKAKGLSSKQKRDLKMFQIKPEAQRYELFLPLHDLWRQYILDLCGGLQPTTCASYVGLTGILIQEFKHVFKIITNKDEIKVIPKRHSVFEMEVNGFVSHIYGSRIEQRASERSAKKFKSKGAIDL
ncbi:hypothetical protein NQD34_001367 [Periophthalmus magnuspinnatus]|nr:hypothetical protein NQD34_001367 [Periophthalmus magnuspinnatus]